MDTVEFISDVPALIAALDRIDAEETMTTVLIVDPVKLEDEGSYGIVRKLTAAQVDIAEATKDPENQDFQAMAQTMQGLDKLLKAHVHTENGTDLNEALDKLSVPKFYELLGSILGGEPVPTESAEG